MIDPTTGMAPGLPAIDPVQPAVPRPDAARDRPAPETPPEPAGRPAPPPNDPVLDVHLDGETMRLYTELRDPVTDRLLLRLPAAYKTEEGQRDAGTSFEA